MNWDRNNISSAKNLPDDFDVNDGTNVKWEADLGTHCYGEPVVALGKIFIGTNNENPRNPAIKGDKGVMIAFDQESGKFLWQLTFDKVFKGNKNLHWVNDWPLQGIRSTPYVEEDRMYFLNNRSEMVCADIEGMRDGKNDGPYKDEKYTDNFSGDIIWKYDLVSELGVFPRPIFGAINRPLVIGDLVYFSTNNGVDESLSTVPSPDAPDIIAINKNTGKLVWKSSLSGKNNQYASVSNPVYHPGNDTIAAQLIFAAGDQWLYSLDPKTGNVKWKFNLFHQNLKDDLKGQNFNSEF